MMRPFNDVQHLRAIAFTVVKLLRAPHNGKFQAAKSNVALAVYQWPAVKPKLAEQYGPAFNAFLDQPETVSQKESANA